MALPYTVTHVATSNKVVAISFDDGPNEDYTPQFLKILKDSKIKATFFLLGEKVKRYPKLTQRIYREGHDIGNHSFSHKKYTRLSERSLLVDLAKSQKAFKEVLGFFPVYFRQIGRAHV